VNDEPFLIDLSAPAPHRDARRPGDEPMTRRRRYQWAAGLAALAAFAGVWIPLHSNPSTVPVWFPPTVEGVPLNSGLPIEISGNFTTHEASYRFPLTNAGTTTLDIERLSALVPGLVLLRADPAQTSIAARHSKTVTLIFEVSDCSDVLTQQDQRALRVVVDTALGPVEWQVALASLLPGRQWQVDIAAAACRN
jgi:hypothetical protein